MKVTSGKVWPPGFRFHPTDEELVLYYLKRKICKRKIKINIIAETDVYKWDPEELPGQSLLKTGDRQWFFFSPRDRKYPNGARSNRATRLGYWKTTGKDRNVTCDSRNVGLKKTLVFYRGRAPNGERSDWVMHEYILDEEELKRCQNVQDYYVLYKVFKKSGPGPKNGEQYGAPFKEEEWIDEEDVDVAKAADQETPAKQLNEVAAVDNMKRNNKVSPELDDIEEFINQLIDEPLPTASQISCAYKEPQVVGEEETQSTLMNPHSREIMFSKPISMGNGPASFDFTQSASWNLQMYEASEVTSASKNCEPALQLCGEDFLEIDDLIGPEPYIYTDEKPVEDLQFDQFDGMNELDLFHDAAMFLHDLGPVDQETVTSLLGNNIVDHVDHQFQPQLVVNQVDQQLQPSLVVNQINHQMQPNLVVNQADYQLQPHSLGAERIYNQPWMHDQLSNVFTLGVSKQGIPCPPTSGLVDQSTNHPTEANQNQSGEEGGGTPSWFSSSLWAFVESIPTSPASASECPLVNRAFERMSSFSRLKIAAGRNTCSARGDITTLTRRQASCTSNWGFFILSLFGALCAIIWMFMGTMRFLGRSISS